MSDCKNWQFDPGDGKCIDMCDLAHTWDNTKHKCVPCSPITMRRGTENSCELKLSTPCSDGKGLLLDPKTPNNKIGICLNLVTDNVIKDNIIYKNNHSQLLQKKHINDLTQIYTTLTLHSSEAEQKTAEDKNKAAEA